MPIRGHGAQCLFGDEIATREWPSMIVFVRAVMIVMAAVLFRPARAVVSPHPVPHQLSPTRWDHPGSGGKSAAAITCRKGTRRDERGRRRSVTLALEDRQGISPRGFESLPLRFHFRMLDHWACS